MARGGFRSGAGRPKGQGKYLESTKPIRIPISLVGKVHEYIDNKCFNLPLYQSAVRAGFPSPADDYIAETIDLNKYLIKHPTATFLVRVIGDSMIDAGINDGDVLVVDRSLEVKNGNIVIASINGELTVKKILKNNRGVLLNPANKKYSPIELKDFNDNIIWGVVTSVIHKF
ncbi:MAG: translesion error-prone DNA polymerase V autoproteolytic subunit [Alphaproteobacteria bacterium]|nr:translesion error-prone DNA polymerase V autoproteolytic subunit [Alphaproteobacteria bacterium]